MSVTELPVAGHKTRTKIGCKKKKKKKWKSMINKKELDAIVKLDPLARYKYFIKRIADFEELYSIGEDENPWVIEYGGKLALALWPFKEFVEYYKEQRDDFDDSFPLKMSINEFNLEGINRLKKNGIHIVDIFPIDKNSGRLISVDIFFEDLNIELNNYK